jgi:hypothetical protein
MENNNLESSSNDNNENKNMFNEEYKLLLLKNGIDIDKWYHKLLTNMYYSINNIKPDLKCLLFSPDKLKKEETKLIDKFKIITQENSNYEQMIHSKDPVYTISTEINFNTKMNDIIDIVNNKKYSDKLEIISLISKSLYFYIENGKRVDKILLNIESYKQWCENISNNNLSTIGDYINLQKWLKNSNLNILLETEYSEAIYTKKTFNHNYFFFLISGSGTAKREDIKGQTTEVSITKQQIENYKAHIKEYMKYDLVREYSIIDFMLKILKLRTNISYVDIGDSDLFRMFDIYYMYTKSEKYIDF